MQSEIPIKILLADDDIDDRFFFEKAVKSIPIVTQLITVSNGEELMHYLHTNLMNLPDVLFLDLSMPRKTGFECLLEMNEDENLPNCFFCIIGKNGTGKTKFISQLAIKLTDNNEQGEFQPSRPIFSKIIASSFSYFDKFKFPKISTMQTLSINHKQLRWLLSGFDFNRINDETKIEFNDYF